MSSNVLVLVLVLAHLGPCADVTLLPLVDVTPARPPVLDPLNSAAVPVRLTPHHPARTGIATAVPLPDGALLTEADLPVMGLALTVEESRALRPHVAVAPALPLPAAETLVRLLLAVNSALLYLVARTLARLALLPAVPLLMTDHPPHLLVCLSTTALRPLLRVVVRRLEEATQIQVWTCRDRGVPGLGAGAGAKLFKDKSLEK